MKFQGIGLWHVWGVAIGCLSITWWDAFDEKACFEVEWKRKILVTYG